jgi:16S rRNA C967 or C1407 C5-methylase (RsmB/RsmF family)/NOL1/NOP2/fmu family ribosome biogenesis protein
MSSTLIDLPIAFVERIESEGFYPDTLLSALNTTSPISIRQHLLKIKHSFERKAIIPWCVGGEYLTERPSYTLDPLFHAGCYYPQEAGSMNLDGIIRQLDLPEEPIVLDLCAAPGGKSTLLTSVLEGKGLLIANEPVPNRAVILKENLIKWGYKNTIVVSNKPSDFGALPFHFDVIAVDAPCSGEGMFRKDQNARSEWNPSNADMCAVRQQEIITEIWPTLAENGYLIYSTCTFNANENEELVRFMQNEFDATVVDIKVDERIKNGRENLGYYCLPGTVETEGFYFAVLQKKSPTRDSKSRIKAKSTIHHDLKLVESFVDVSKEDAVLLWENKLFLHPKKFTDHFLAAQSCLRIMKFGTELGEIAKKGLIPHHALAMQANSNPLKKSSIEIDRTTALSYLKGDAIKVDGALGWVTVTYKNQALGWINNLGTRSNNLYPKAWRIRMKTE